MDEPSARLPVRLLSALALSAALAPLNSTMIAVALPEIGRSLRVDSGPLRQALVTSYLLTSIVLQSPGGKLGDRLGHRYTLGLGQLVLAVGAALAYVFPVLPILAASRVAMAMGGAIIVPSAMALLRSELPEHLRGRAFGLFGAVMGLSAGIGPMVGSVLVEHFGWVSIYLANVPVLLLSAALAHLGQGQTHATRRTAPRPRFDILGSVLLGASLIGLVIGLQNSQHRIAAVFGALGLVPFALWEKRAQDPVIDFSLFKQRAFVAGSLIIALQNLAMYSTIFELPQVAGRLFTLGPRDIGHALLSMMGMMVVVSPLAGRATDRFGSRAVAVIGCTLALLGTGFLFLRPLFAMTDAMPGLMLLGAGLGMTSAPSQSAAIGDVPKEKSGMAAGLTATMRYIGGIAGLTILSLVLTETPARTVVLHEHRTATAIYSSLLALAVFLALLLPRRKAA